MAFYLSPGVKIKETDLSGTVGAVATSIAAIVLRTPYKGEEYTKHLVTNEERLISLVGYPSNTSFKDIMSALGYLKYGNTLYVSIARPDDATFAGTKILTGYNDDGAALSNYSYGTSATINDAGATVQEGTSYSAVSLGLTDLSTEDFVETLGTFNSNEMLKIMARWRGFSGQNVRVLCIDKYLYEAVKYLDVLGTTPVERPPSGLTITDTLSGYAVNMYDDYDGDVEDSGWTTVRNLNTPLDDYKQFVIIVQDKAQTGTTWTTQEIWVCSSDTAAVDDEGNNIYVETLINENSNYIRVVLNPAHKTSEGVDGGNIEFGTMQFIQLAGGYDGQWGRSSGSTATEEEDANVIEAYELYSNPDEIDVNIFIDSDKNQTVKESLITLCQITRMDCMAILDCPRNKVLNNKGSEATELVEWRSGQRSSTFNPNTSYAALYGNWGEVFDKYNKKYRWIPLSGHIAGIYAHTDNVTDPWWAPAGLNRAILTGVRRLAWNPDDGDIQILSKSGINTIVSFSGKGKVIWDSQTLLDKTSAFRAINVRRLFLVLEKAISKASKFYIFEQNDEVTWMLMRNMIEPFLRDVKGRRGVFDFRVQIDETTNTPERIDREELWGNIWIKPTRTARFIVLNFIATKTGASFDELIASGVA